MFVFMQINIGLIISSMRIASRNMIYGLHSGLIKQPITEVMGFGSIPHRVALTEFQAELTLMKVIKTIIGLLRAKGSTVFQQKFPPPHLFRNLSKIAFLRE